MDRLSYKQLSLTPEQEWELGAFGTREVSAIGNVELLKASKLGLLCSVRCPAKIILKSYNYVRTRGKELTVVSGFHSPVEKECLKILIQIGSSVVFCPSQSLNQFKIHPDLKSQIDLGRLLVLSIFQRSFKKLDSQRAYQRNKFVAILSDNMLIPFADTKSKTLELVRFMISRGKTVSAFDASENLHLFKLGVKRI